MTKIFTLKEVIENPIDAYEEFRIRLDKYGYLASFPEFKETVDFLIDSLKSVKYTKLISDNESLKLEYNEVMTFLFHINLTFNVDDSALYPYIPPFKNPYPYRPTIDAIENAIRLLDKLNRMQPDSKAVSLYHFDRYCYHRHSIVVSDDVIIFPTFVELNMLDFIKVRCVPIEFVGVISETTRVDGHQQSPLDF